MRNECFIADGSAGIRAENGLATYRRDDVVAQYSRAQDLQAVEACLFQKYVPGHARILDLGVGGGRTTPHLSARASTYVGVDYSPEMVATCRARFAQLTFQCRDAADLSGHEDASFDVVVFSFNGIDHLYPDGARLRCLGEVERVLAAGGRFIFSMHNARGLLIRPARQGRSLVETAQAASAAAAGSLMRAARRITTQAFWRGHGYLSQNGDDYIHYSTPPVVSDELARSGLRLVALVGEAYPRRLPMMASRWIYYVAEKPMRKSADG